MPGVFVLTWDNCMYGEQYVHRQCYITNMWFLAGLSRDCDIRVTIARGGTPIIIELNSSFHFMIVFAQQLLPA